MWLRSYYITTENPFNSFIIFADSTKAAEAEPKDLLCEFVWI